jgi:NTP pyrophosphatase (non-canonical NTP hydrolase)
MQDTQERVQDILDRYGADENIYLAGLGLAGESGEVADNIKKFGYGVLTMDELRDLNKDELQDCLYFVVVNAIKLGLNFNELCQLMPDRLERKIAKAKGILIN